MDTRSRQRLHLLGCSSLTAGNDRTGVAHATSRRRGLPGDEADNRLLNVLLYVFRCRLLCCAADFANQDDRLGLGVFVQQFQRIDVRRANDWVAADTNGR